MNAKIKSGIVAMAMLFGYSEISAQVPTNQDCLNAIPICQNTYSTTQSYSGTGNYPNEINNGVSCLGSGEKNDVWYTFTTPFFGNLNFTITPNNGTDDYDWAVYNLTNNTCADIYTNPGIEVSCNYAPNLGCGGTTGPNNNTGGACGGQNEASIPVTPGQTYVINVSNFSSTQSGYVIDFNASTAGIFDVFPPGLNSSSTPTCGTTSITWTFTENITCASVQPSDFVLTGPGGPYTVNSVTSTSCATGAAYGKVYTVNFTPAIAFSGAYNLALVSPVTDLCGNNFIVPYNKAYSVNGVNLVKNHTDVTCPGDDDGTITLNAIGAGPFTYQWSPNVSSTNTATGLPGGVYTITVTPSNGSCPGQATITVIENLPVTLQSQNIVSTGCSAPVGSISVTPTGGVGPYTYLWSPSGGTGSTASNLATGNYTVTVTDSKGCDMTQMFAVPSVNNLNVAVSSIQNVKCTGGSTGAITTNITGNTGAVTYLWSNSATSSGISGIAAGTYSVTVTEGICTATAQNIFITEPATALAAAPVATPTTCGAGNGTATINAVGGTGAYSYVWSPSGNGAVSSGLSSGNYTVTITDANLCSVTKNFSVGASSAPVPSVSYTRQTVSCFGGNNGTATVNVVGGVGPYTFQWSGGMGTGNSKNNLTAGAYSVTVSDALNCTATIAVTINAPVQLTATAANIQHVKCFGLSTGSATINAAGGTGALTYQWSPAGGNSSSSVNLAAGAYTVTVTDANACTKVVNLNINQPASALGVVASATSTSCGNSNGTSSSVASGGTAPYAYLWSNASNTANTSSLAAGTYTVTVTDANLCSKTQSVFVASSSAPVISNPVIQNLLCAGVSTGSITVSVASGSLPYSFAWTGNVSTTNSAANLAAGNYVVTVTDNAGCTSTLSNLVTAPSALNIQTVSLTNVKCFGQNTGAIQTNATGGTGTFTYLWSSGNTTSTLSSLYAGSYTITATDQNGCIKTQTFAITQPAAALSSPLTASPTSCGLLNGGITSAATGGTTPYQYLWSSGTTGYAINNISSGTYTLTVTDANGCIKTQSANVAASSAPVVSNAVIQNLTCAGINTGSIGFTVNGGITPYTYAWTNNVSTTNQATNISAGSYSISVTDNAGCTVIANYSVTTPPAITVTLNNKTDIECYGNNTGSIDVTATGGTGTLSYFWSNSLTTPVISGLTNGTYTVSVTDQNNCKKTQTYTLTQPASALSNQITQTATSCGLSNGVARAIPAGGTSPYKYLWSNGANTAQISSLSTGNYTVIVSDDNGCSLSQSTFVAPSSAVTIAASQHTDALCYGTPTGSASITPSGGIAPYSYAWSNGQTTQQLSAIAAGNYQVTVTDQAGCTSTSSIVVTQPAAVQIMMPSAQTICPAVNTILTPQVSGGTPPYQYGWSNGSSTASITVAPATSSTYNVTVSDANGCVKQSVSSSVNVYSPVSLAALTNRSVCEGASVTFSATPSGGNGVYQYNWNSGQGNNANFTNTYNSTSNINLVVKDGCNYTSVQNAVVNVVPLPEVDFTNDINAGCLPLTVNFSDKSIAVPGSSYSWNFADGNNSSDVGNVMNVFSEAGIYRPSLTITTPAPELCTATYTLPQDIISLALPEAAFSYAPDEPTILNPMVSFKNLSSFANIYSWSFGDGSTSSEADPAHTYTTIGTYTLLLTASNSYCEDTALRIIEITDQYSVYIPKAFSPNGDGRNDVFEAYATNIVEATIGIYNRWGQRVFATNTFPFTWNGQMNNSEYELPTGVYVYSISAIDKFGNKHVYNGTVSLLR